MTSSMKCLGAAVAAMMLASWAVGCGGAAEEQPPPPPPPPPPPVVDAGPPPPPPPPPEPTACDATQSLALTTMLQGREKTDAPGMKAQGGPTCMVVAEGQMATSQTLMLEPGHCYTVLGQAMGGVTELDLQLVLDTSAALPPAMAAMAAQPVLAVDTESGATASIGPKTSCYPWTLPLQGMVKVTAKARTASSPGPIAFQVYKKKK